jgi:hypothetical protein
MRIDLHFHLTKSHKKSRFTQLKRLKFNKTTQNSIEIWLSLEL